uniref:Nematode cuticle collagen N-terminal domain-containing protein n=1 Tax=Panagrellus redivivus TaxID=6233 RepID=A0A7E4VTG5_PANRE
MRLQRRLFAVLLLFIVLAHAEEEVEPAATDAPSDGKYDVNKCDGAKGAANAGMIAMAVLTAFSVIFAVLVIGASIMVMAKLSEKTREAETHLHQVMDATLTVLHPESVVAEINCVAEEAQQQFKKKDAPDTKTDNEAKSPAKKD